MADAKDIARLRAIMFVRVPAGLAALLAVWLVSAGSLRYWQAWLVTLTFLGGALAVGSYYIRTDPDFLVHRFQFREKEAAQRKIIGPTNVIFLAAMILPGLDLRFGWSRMPSWASLAGLAVMLAGYALVLWVFRTNRYASRIIEVQAGQTVISSGPYRVVRHPMYAAQVVMFPGFMAALGSWWGVGFAALIVVPLVLRIRNEEEVLTRDLPGYAEYCRRTRYRLVPGLW
jgi:protein-S-isoprenylcysteine O-methyltransferase Ste14